MEYRQLGDSGLRVPVLSFGTGTFGGTGPLFSNWGTTGVDGARHLIELCLEAGVTLFDTADVYSDGRSEEVLGAALDGLRDDVLISTKTGLPMGDGPGDWGTGRSRLLRAVEDALGRLRTDRIDLLQLHAFDSSTPAEEVLTSIDMLIRAGKVRYWGVSNYPGWAIMELIAAADRHGLPRPVVHQVYYSLIGRDYEWDLMPLGARHGIGAMVWSPLGWGRLTGKIRRNAPRPETSRLHETESLGPPVDDEHLYAVVDVLEEIAAETGRTVPQIALNWLTRQPTVASVIVGARNEEQLRQNLGSMDWDLSADQAHRLTMVSERHAAYPGFPYRRQEGFARLFPPMVRS
ncbi:aryl-alcohol dehydrogenase-like predicted oxidoreductase [Palleronia aestuarii]|uniref:Aryl-alcohol dehydrogenase-like predicted oxidoreductase n=1 Tax=Palleronia aestuarii TaxID=568105 RepID=A0A2W7N3B4_9RHOB|nr:aldo/keto reductase [Palleronia aestuarii]PZX11314.1 aryl-alcohol dehydrogenase-like predicted oxidoreductase [Palleronia aestuarii]